MSIVEHVLSAAPAQRLHTKMGSLMEVAEQLGVHSETQLLQVCVGGCVRACVHECACFSVSCTLKWAL